VHDQEVNRGMVHINPSPDRECLLLCASARNASVRFRRNFARIAVHREGQRRVDLTRSPSLRRMTGVCAFETFEATSRIDDVERS
jgi:hypothetical protein